MSTLKVNKIENTATTDGGIEIDNTGHVQIDGIQLPSAGPLSNRNLVINGDMRVAQRGTAAVTAGGGRPVDRWLTAIVSAGTFSLQQTTANVPPGFTHALLATVTGADATTDAGDVWWIEQRLESQDTDFLQYATANAQSLTLSFWVRSSVSGTYCATITAHDGTNPSARSHVKEYTINSADTWEHKTLTFPGPTSGTVLSNTNTQGLSARFGLVSGTNSQVTADTWVNVNATGTANQTQLLETLNANWLVTGVQLEAGEKATPFEHRSFGDELARCERYYQQSYTGSTPVANNGGTICATCCGNTNRAFGNVYWSTTMRQAPTVTWFAGSNGTENKWRNNSQGTDITPPSPNSGIGTRGYGFVLSSGISAVTDTLVGHYTADAEL